MKTKCDRNHRMPTFDCTGWYVAQGQRTACVYCVSEWKRENRPIEAGDIYYVPQEWVVKYAKIHGNNSPEDISAFTDTLLEQVRDRLVQRVPEKEKNELIARYGDRL